MTKPDSPVRRYVPRRRQTCGETISIKHHTVTLHKSTTTTTLGLRMILAGEDSGYGLVGHVDPHSLAWRAGMRTGDEITAVLFDSSRYAVNSGEMTCELLRPAQGKIIMRLRRRQLSAHDQAAIKLQSAWKGTAVRIETSQVLPWQRAASLHASRKRPIRSPPRLSVGDDSSDDDDE